MEKRQKLTIKKKISKKTGMKKKKKSEERKWDSRGRKLWRKKTWVNNREEKTSGRKKNREGRRKKEVKDKMRGKKMKEK